MSEQDSLTLAQGGGPTEKRVPVQLAGDPHRLLSPPRTPAWIYPSMDLRTGEPHRDGPPRTSQAPSAFAASPQPTAPLVCLAPVPGDPILQVHQISTHTT